LENVKEKPVKRAKLPDTRPQKIPAVQISHPGTSYQPTEEDHKAAIDIAAAVEFEKIARQEELKQKLSYPAELDDINDEVNLDEESEDSESEEEEPVEAPATKAKSGDPQRKSKADRNKQKRVRYQNTHDRLIRQDKLIIKQINTYIH
jgi:nucleolar protein 53